MANFQRIFGDDGLPYRIETSGEGVNESYSPWRMGSDDLELMSELPAFPRGTDMDFGYGQGMARIRVFQPSRSESIDVISDPGDLAKSDFLRAEKTGYQDGDFDRRYVSKAGDTMTAIFKKEYGYTPSANELIQYATLNGMNSPHQLSVNRVINSPDINRLLQTDVSQDQVNDYWKRNAIFNERRRVTAISDPLTSWNHVNGTLEERKANIYFLEADRAEKLRLAQVKQRELAGNQLLPMTERSKFSKSYDEMLKVYEDLKKDTLEKNNALIANEPDSLLGKITKYNSYPRDLGISLLDAGLGFGKLAASTYDSTVNGTLMDDVNKGVGDTIKRVGKGYFTPDHVRLAVKYGANKFMIGSDGIGVQYKDGKTKGLLDQVGKFSYKWGDSSPKFESSLERNFPALRIPLPKTVSVLGRPIELKMVQGIRQNLNGDGVATPSTNFEVSTPEFPKFGVSLELRKNSNGR